MVGQSFDFAAEIAEAQIMVRLFSPNVKQNTEPILARRGFTFCCQDPARVLEIHYALENAVKTPLYFRQRTSEKGEVLRTKYRISSCMASRTDSSDQPHTFFFLYDVIQCFISMKSQSNIALAITHW